MMIPTTTAAGHGMDPAAKNPIISANNALSDSPIDRVAMARETAVKLEATFLSEMLKSAGFGMQANSFSGSAGEDQFASFKRNAIAEQMARSGGVGLAEHFFNAIMEGQKDG